MKYETQNIFFISDLHLGHKNILKYDKRPYRDLDEMHSQLVKNWNNVVGENDIVYHLGDLLMGNSETLKWFLYSVKGKIYNILGNHDRPKDLKKIDRFETVHEYGTEIWVKDESEGTKKSEGYQQIIMSHYPILSWNREHYGSWHLHGHCHGSLIKSNPVYYQRKVIDVGCCCIDYTPISYGRVKDVMKLKSHQTFHH